METDHATSASSILLSPSTCNEEDSLESTSSDLSILEVEHHDSDDDDQVELHHEDHLPELDRFPSDMDPMPSSAHHHMPVLTAAMNGVNRVAAPPLQYAQTSNLATVNSTGLSSTYPYDLGSMYPGFIMPQTHSIAPCILTTPGVPNAVLQSMLVCTSCTFNGQPCSIHHAPIAYGQATPSYSAPPPPPPPSTNPHHNGQQQIQNTPNTHQIGLSTHPLLQVNHIPMQRTQSEQQRRDIELARQQTTLPPTLPINMRNMSSMRLKRGPSLNASVRSAIDASRAPKLRRVSSDSHRDIQTVQSDHPQQSEIPPPPSSSQHVTGTMPSSIPSTSNICITQHPRNCPGCPPLPPCMCSIRAAQQHSTVPLVAPTVSMAVPPHISQINANRFVHDSLITNQIQSHIMEAQAQAAHHQRYNNNLQQQQLNLHAMQHILNQQNYRPANNNQGNLFLYQGNVLPYSRSRIVELNMLVNILPSDMNGDRPILERHHMFAAPLSEPQPVGATPQDIEKCTEKIQFVKDGEIPETETERCTVCLCDFETGEEIRNLHCTHIFHTSCIDKWLIYNKKCPVCRLDVDKHKAVLVE